MNKLTFIFLSCLSLSSIGNAATTYVVPNDSVRTTTLVLPDFGDVGIVEEFGVISVTGMPGIVMNNNNQKSFNYGSIFTIGNNSSGVISNGNNNILNNYGFISAIGNNSAGMENTTGNNVEMTNYGVIIISGDSAGMVSDNGSNIVMTNNGKIFSSEGGVGMTNYSDNSILTNNGFINISGQEAGLENFNSNVVINNNGSIFALTNGTGIYNFGPDVKIINTGFILTDGALGSVVSIGILADVPGDNVLIINSGTIISKKSHAIQILTQNPSLVLLRGSNIQGSVDVSADFLDLTVERGLNLTLTLTPVSPGFGALSIDAPYVVLGKTVVVIDPTGFGLQSDVVADLSDTLFNGIYRHRTGLARQCNPCGCEFWVEGIGSYRKRSLRTNVGYENSQGGFIFGANNPFFNGLGVFGAVSFEKAKVDQKTQTANITTYIGGITYEEVFCNTFFGFALALGCLDWSNERFVMNNLAEGGVERAQFDKGAFFVSPEFMIAHKFSCLSLFPVVSFTCRYAGCFFGDYQEKGSVANLSVRDREVDLITTRFELSVPFTDVRGNCCWSVEPYVGGYGRFQIGENEVHAVLLNQSISFDVGNSQNLGACLVGCRGIQSFGRCNLFLNFEVSFDNARSTRVIGEGGFGVYF